MLLIPCYVAPSTIDGLGLFTRIAVLRGQTLWRLTPGFDRVFSRAEYEAAPAHLRDYYDRYAYPHKDDPDLLVLEIDDGRFMNHSSTPNCDFSTWGIGVALVDIAAGEELTCDYAGFCEGYYFMPDRMQAEAE